MKAIVTLKKFSSCAFLTLVLLLLTQNIEAQAVGINEDGSAPNSKSILDVKSVTKGLLTPRMSTAQRLAIAPGATEGGLIVYDTDLDRYMFYTGSSWVKLGEGFWYETGAGMRNGVEFIGINTPPVSNLPLAVAAGDAPGARINNASGTSNFTLKLHNTEGTSLAAFSGASSSGYPSTPAAIYASGRDGANGAFISATDAGTGVVAQSNGTGPALDAWAFGDGLAGYFRGGNVHIVESLGVGVNPALAQLQVESAGQSIARFTSPSNTLMTIYNGATYAGFIQAYGDDFYFGRFSGTGSIVLSNVGNRFNLESDGDVSIGTSAAVSNKLRVEGSSSSVSPVVSSQVNYAGSNDVRALEGFSVPADGYGYGGYFTGGYRGVYGLGDGGAYAGGVIGVYGYATGTAGTRYGLYGYASGGSTNWAGYFSSGNVYITNDLRVGASGGATGYKVSVDGKIICEELKVQNSTAWPDYVFETDYNLTSILDVEQYILQHKRLPGIPSAADIDENGIEVGDMQKRLMEKIEELTLYIIGQEKRINELEGMIHAQQH